jgi:outer membrane protein assembly factor BamE (lipoprotein component of BamABCDE complex)
MDGKMNNKPPTVSSYYSNAKFHLLLLTICSSTLFGCVTASQHQQSLPQTAESRMTVGLVQKEIKKGMTQADVAQVLGSPNLVTRDKSGMETWIYDKIRTEVSYSKSSGGVGGLVFGAIGGGMLSASGSSGASASTQRTLTVILKFDENVLEEFTYNASSF